MGTTDTQASTFDADALRRGIEERDAEALLGLYADDAELRIVDAENGPSKPRILRGRAEISAYLSDVCSRDMTHSLERVVIEHDHGAYEEACRYPGGIRVLCVATLDLADGQIVRQSGVQAWDA